MRTVNEVTLLGNVGQEPKIIETGGGVLVANVSLATSFRKKDKTEVTEWHRLVAFSRTAEIIRDYVVKGSKLYIKGQLQTRSYDKDGVRTYSTEIVIRDLSLLSNRAADASKAAPLNGGTGDAARGVNPEISDDDIPF
jgi:single-strand DNA-binding protein